MAFTKTYKSLRNVDTLHSDTLQRIALREMGDAGRWAELATINNLKPPYITDDPVEAGNNVLLSGASIRVPSNNQYVSAIDDPDYVFGSDVKLDRGELSATDGDLTLVSGVPNLSQALQNVLETEPGELLFHSRYGCSVQSMVGTKNITQRASFVSAFIKRSLLADHRISDVRNVSVVASGDLIAVEAGAVTVDGKQVTTKVNYGISG